MARCSDTISPPSQSRSRSRILRSSRTFRPVMVDQLLPGLARDPRRRGVRGRGRSLRNASLSGRMSSRRSCKAGSLIANTLRRCTILAELTVGDGSLQVAIGCRHDSSIGAQHSRAAEPLKFPFLQHPKELRLR